ncbi:hypothetical protein Y032_0258g434 [Ancylostoma ceylanicum]|uniref:Peptidase A1 domain-containing protein n=1 Tax=Ancylostoma ceylanicum TaxID=53326 RepID=A0A016SBD4_9BILA|nr:hypothetical protein Y032_0258g434 [Ancylostoma ceylanicum]
MLVVVGLLAIASGALASIYRVPLIKVESEMVRMLRQKTWGAHIKRMESQGLDLLRNFPMKENRNQPLYYDLEYVGNITVGTPDQTFQVAVDTGSADFWIVDDTCAPDYPEVCDKSVCDTGCCDLSEAIQEFGLSSEIVEKAQNEFRFINVRA